MERAEITYLTVAAFENSFLPGDRANLNFVSMTLYEYQDGSCPTSEIQQDIVWAASKINPDFSSWLISREEYELALSIVSPTFVRSLIASFNLSF
jgi:hypothetical protein